MTLKESFPDIPRLLLMCGFATVVFEFVVLGVLWLL